MSDVISSLKAALLGRRDSGLSIPIMDGAFKPNNLLETAAVFAERPGLEDLALDANGALHAACGKSVFRIDAGGGFTQIATFDRDVTALALMKGGAMAVALGDAVLISGDGVAADRVIDQCDGRKFVAVNALHARADGTLLITDGSTAQPYPAWSRDLLDSGASGRLLAHDLRANKTCVLASNLAYAFGAYSDATGGVLVSESWRHRLDAVANTKRTPALAALPGYPSRMSAASYREEMMRTIESQYWVAPALSSGDDFLEPLQGGGVKQMGILKPWAPPRSYGLVVRVGADMIPKYSLHSRVGGKHHGIVSVAQKHDDLYVLSKGSGRILKLSVREFESGASQ
jgi:hypothetical protein